MRALLVIVATLTILAGALLGLDLHLTASAEERVAEAIGETLGVPAEVDIAGWPVTARTLVTGRVPHVAVLAVDVPSGGAGGEGSGSIDRLEMRFVDVDLDLDGMRGRGGAPPRADEARFEAEIGRESLLELLQLPEGLLDVSLDGGVMRLDVAGLRAVDASIGASGGVVVVEPHAPTAGLVGLARIPIDLSGQPGHPYVEHAEVAGDRLLLRGRLEEMTVGIR